MMIQVIAEQQKEVANLCKQYRIQQLYLFGSAAKGKFDPAASDLDFMAYFADRNLPDYADRYIDFAHALEALFHRKVDLLTDRMMRNPDLRAEIEKTRQIIYDEGSLPTAA